MSIVVPGRGPLKARAMLVGEAPGAEEASSGVPFVGRAGREQDRYLANAGLHRSNIYMTNLVKDYIEGNPDPTPELIEKWGPRLLQEVDLVKPRFIITVGRFATRFFLGDVDMDAVHGIPHLPLRPQHAGMFILPCYHPAYGFYDDDARPLIYHDYMQAGLFVRGELQPSAHVKVDDFPDPVYMDVDYPVDGWDFAVGAIDTEGVPGDEWSLQVSIEPGSGFIFRKSSSHFARNMAYLKSYIDARDPMIVVHSAMYDYEMARLLGVDLFEARLFDTMYAAYLLRTEPQGLKTLAYRWCGMEMASYEETVGDIGLEKQLSYLGRILADAPWPKPEPRIEYGNDGSARLYTPQPVERRAEAILDDFYSDKLDKNGHRCDPMARWKKVDKQLRTMVEQSIGPMPIGTLADIPLESAIYYAGRDPDATLRLYYRLLPVLQARGLLQLKARGAQVLPVFEEMQANGMLAIRSRFEKLRDDMWREQGRIQSYISHRFFDGRPFNCNSPPQVATLMRRRGLTGEKRTASGTVSTSKKSIEHLRYEDDAIAHVIDWREHAKIKDSFANPILDRIPDDVDRFRIRTTIKTTRVSSRRISSSDPNLTAIPVRNELGLRVRDGFEAEHGCDLGSWDLSQIEMRYMAHLSRDPLLCQFLIEGRDPHAETAARIFGIKLADVKEMDHRYPAKRAGFGIITNIQGQGLLDQLRMFGCPGWDEDSCDRLIREWLRVYKGVAAFLDACRDEVRQTGIVRDAWGHIRYLPGVWSDDKRVRAEAERAASSHKIQGGAQGMIQESMAWLKPYIRGLQNAGAVVRWILQIHDEIILEFQEDLWETLDPLVIEGLTEHSLKLIVPVKAKGSRAKTWGKLKA